MSFQISAPWPTTRVTVLLPNPSFSDSRAPEITVDLKRSMNGEKVFSYIKTSNREKLVLPFRLSAEKAMELEAFVRLYFRATMLLVNQDGARWQATLISNPFKRTSSSPAFGWPSGEAVDVELQFSAVRDMEVELT